MPRALLSAVCSLLAASAALAAPPNLKILFLGDNAGHQPASRFRLLEPVFAKRGIQLTYTDKLDDITLDNLNKYDGLMIYANHTPGKPEHVKAILDYVESGKGFIPIHSASFCFTNDQRYIDLVGAQFRSHTTGVFRTQTVAPEHPIMKGCQSFESWDETYLHHKHNEKDRTVLEVRAERDLKEPWTWVRTQGKGRVFYTAWGHDHRTWSNDGFQTLVERGTRWACGQDLAGVTTYADAPEMTKIAGSKEDFEYVPAKVPFYPPSQRWGVQADPITKMQKPLPVEKSMRHYSVPQGFELQLFATDEQFDGKPLTMTWDERGRLWVSVTKDYPNELQREGEGRDKIVILEDADGDGKADKTTVFADTLSIPTSLLCAHGGVIVHQAPHTLFLKDTDGDGKADVRQVLLTGWGTTDTHAGPSNLRYGFDNWVYGIVGYSGYTGTVNGERHNFRQGLYRFKVEKDGEHKLKVVKLELLRNTNNNSWGVAFNEDGELFGSTANGCPLVHVNIPNRYYEKVRGANPGVLPNIALSNTFHPITDKVRQVDWHNGFTAGSGLAVYTARTYPAEYWNRIAFLSDPTGHLTASFVLQRSGTDFVARYGWNLVASDDEWAAPIDAHVGPDGNVWLIDWYNFIVQHNPTPQGFQTGKGGAYESDLRDKSRGRVYRVVYSKAKAAPQPTLAGAKSEALVAALKSDNMFWRLHAQRLLVEAGDRGVVPALTGLVAASGDNPYAAVHALWALDGLGVATAAKGESLNHPSAAVRKAALATLPKDAGSAEQIVNSNLLEDPDSGVRLAALLALADTPSSELAGPVLAKRLAAIDPTTDRGLSDATLAAAVTHAAPVLKALAGSNARWSREALNTVERIATSYAATSPEGVGTLLAAVGRSPVADAVVTGLTNGWPRGAKAKLSAEDEAAFAQALGVVPEASRGKLLKLAAAWGVKGIDAQLAEMAKGLLTTALDPAAAESARLAAARQVIEFTPNDEAAAEKLAGTITYKSSPAYVNGLIEALAASKAKSIGPALVAKLTTLPPLSRPAAMQLILARPEPTKAFLDAVEQGSLRFDMLALDQKAALASHPDAGIAERAQKLLAMGGGLPDANRQKVIEEFHDTLAKSGDAGTGKKVFTQHCAKCHKHSGEGAQIGPDLTGFAVHPKEEILIHVLDPSRSVEGNYKAYTAQLLDGRVVTGLLSAQTRTTVELLDAENKRHTFNTADLDGDVIESKKSLMPEGFEKQMSKDDMVHLLTFMTQKGKYVPIPLDKVATVVSTRGMFFNASQSERLVFPNWGPKEFNGVPFVLVDPSGDKLKNVVMLNGPNGDIPPKMPKAVTLPCNTSAKAIHFLSGIGGWSYPASERGTVSMIVRLQYADGQTEDHELKNGVHFADYIRRVDVPESKYAFRLRGQQVRYLSVAPKRTDAVIKQIELVKGKDVSAPIVMAVTVETP